MSNLLNPEGKLMLLFTNIAYSAYLNVLCQEKAEGAGAAGMEPEPLTVQAAEAVPGPDAMGQKPQLNGKEA